MSQSNETRKPTGRPSLLSAEQQNTLEQQPALPVVVPQEAEMPLRKHLWVIAGLSVLAIGAAIAVMQFVDGPAEPPAAIAAAAPTKVATPAPAPAVAQAADATPPAAAATPAPAVAAIIDEAPPPGARPKESLAQMLETSVAPAGKPAAAKPVTKPVKEKSVKASDKSIAAAAPEQDTDVELLAALVAHTKFDTSANARLTLPKALEQCKKQEKQDAALCRIRVCEGRWKKDECRAYSRSKLEKAASGA